MLSEKLKRRKKKARGNSVMEGPVLQSAQELKGRLPRRKLTNASQTVNKREEKGKEEKVPNSLQ